MAGPSARANLARAQQLRKCCTCLARSNRSTWPSPTPPLVPLPPPPPCSVRAVQDEDVIRFFIDPSLAGAQPGGGVEAVRVVRDPRTSQGKGIAFVLFASPQACKVGRLGQRVAGVGPG